MAAAQHALLRLDLLVSVMISQSVQLYVGMELKSKENNVTMETTQITLAAFSLAQDLFMDGFAQEETYQILINALKFAGMVF